MSDVDVKSVLEKHLNWLRDVEGGERADLSGINLGGVDLSGATLREADMLCTYLLGANLSRADLSGADLNRSDLNGADLSGADLRRADLCCADLSDANLRRADLGGTNLRGTKLPIGVRIISVTGVGSEREMTTFRADTDEVWCGAFYGSLQKFAEYVEGVHKGDEPHLADYRSVLSMLEAFRTNDKRVIDPEDE